MTWTTRGSSWSSARALWIAANEETGSRAATSTASAESLVNVASPHSSGGYVDRKRGRAACPRELSRKFTAALFRVRVPWGIVCARAADAGACAEVQPAGRSHGRGALVLDQHCPRACRPCQRLRAGSPSI